MERAKGATIGKEGDIFLGFGEKLEERKGKKKRSHDGERFFFKMRLEIG